MALSRPRDDASPTTRPAPDPDAGSRPWLQVPPDGDVTCALQAAQEKIRNLEIALESRRRIGVAVGILVERLRVSEAQAFEILREASQRNHRKLRDLADELVLTGALPD